MSGQALLKISEDVIEALENGYIVEDKESTTSPYQCKLCLIPLSGLAPLKDHVKSSKHTKKCSAASIHKGISNFSDFAYAGPAFETPTPTNQYIQPVFPSSNVIQVAINKGHIVENHESLTSPYQCKLCHVPLSGLAPLEDHIKSAKHLRKTKEAYIQTDYPDGSLEMSNIEMSPPIHHSSQPVNNNSSQVQDAFSKGHIEGDHQSTTGPFKCKACHVNLSGLAPLEQHVKSAKHMKKTMDSSVEISSVNFATKNASDAGTNGNDRYQTYMEQNLFHCARDSSSMSEPSNDLSSHYVDTVSSVGNESDAVSISFELGHVKHASGFSVGAYFCEICQAPLSGEAPLRQHVNSPNHAKKLMKKYGDLDMSRLKIALPNIDISEEISPMVKMAIEDGHVYRDESSSAGTYYCNICQVPLTGVKPVEQHLQGSNHWGRARQTDNFPNLPVNSPTTTNSLDTPSPQEIPITAQYEVITSACPTQPDENTYQNLSKPRGLVYIFNYTFENDPNNFRPGADCDSDNLKYIFEKMGYRVYINNDLNRDDTYKKVEEIQKGKELQKVDCFIMAILSHGEDNATFYASDMEKISLDYIRYKFIDGKCKQLKGKPKIFLCNYCRGNIKQKHLQTDAPPNYPGREAPKDMVTIYASIDGFKAIRDISKGTIFVQSLYKTLSQNAHNTEFRQIYRILYDIMKENMGTTPELQDYVFKNFYFNPISL
ncbi:unnamed protein product [Meganyctiphanes norvegica]|uniref:Uncharacterized protein n=1 Tax=Meganyctiphanes norvegica TaxID=48144 RepID=A0AAV2R3J3_MEGNR